MVSPQIIIVALALIAFFATGGIDKASRALVTAKSDFTRVKGSLTGFKEKLGEFTGKESVSLSNANQVRLVNPQGLDKIQFVGTPTNPEDIKQSLERGI